MKSPYSADKEEEKKLFNTIRCGYNRLAGLNLLFEVDSAV